MQTAMGREEEEISSHVMQTHHKSSVSGIKVCCSTSVNKPSGRADFLQCEARTAAFSIFSIVFFLLLSFASSLKIKMWPSKADELHIQIQFPPEQTDESNLCWFCRTSTDEADLSFQTVSLNLTGVKTRTELLKPKNRNESFQPAEVLHVGQRQWLYSF